jgi:hypothetical protein
MGCLVSRFPFRTEKGDVMSATGLKPYHIDGYGDRSGESRWLLGFSCNVLLVLLPLTFFAQSHFWQQRPFRATEHSGGDQICDLRSDGNADGEPDRLGDWVSVSGTVIAEPSTFEAGGRIFWIRNRLCGIMVYGEPESLEIGDSILVDGRLCTVKADEVFRDTDLASMRDVAIEKRGVIPSGRGSNWQPLIVSAHDFAARPEAYGGNLITLPALPARTHTASGAGGICAWLSNGSDSVLLYLDKDADCVMSPGSGLCFVITGIVIRINTPDTLAKSLSWCIAPRCQGDILEVRCSSAQETASWGNLKSRFRHQD